MRRLKGRSWINSSVHKSTLGQNKLIHCIWRVNYLCRRYPKAEMARPCTSFDRIIIIVLSDAKGREDVDSWGHTQKDHNINIKKNNKIAILLWIFSSNQLTSNQPLFVKERFLLSSPFCFDLQLSDSNLSTKCSPLMTNFASREWFCTQLLDC